ncbi:type I-E CRISPR-associated protein Cas6/Cse3/CasE [Streptomyces sp. NPDC021020]|uniref:type I-E CRISPR-associated protein Cas6/Cse3/CasE n=1 Tax=Streptomyces sp. NPDC021020 TaxID=3365109 RepID=UPI003794AA96
MTALWLTRLVPDPRNRDVVSDLRSAVSMHRRIMSVFPDHVSDQARHDLGVLFRTDESPTGPQLLIQSNQEPDLRQLPEGYGSGYTKPLTPLLDYFRVGLPLRYRIAASPVRKPGRTSRELYGLKAVVALSGEAAHHWWLRQAQQSGLHISTVTAIPLDPARGYRDAGQRVNHNRILFEGTATIREPDLLRIKVTAGIGRGKSYGCGLLSLAPARDAG